MFGSDIYTSKRASYIDVYSAWLERDKSLCFSANSKSLHQVVAMASASKKLECKDLHGYLKTLPSTILDKLYNHPATCLAVFR